MTEGGNKSEDLWNPYKELLRIVTSYLSGDTEYRSVGQFENILKRHKQNFFSLLQNPPKNAKSREDLKKGMEDGINVRGIGPQTLSKELYQEAIILSDMYDLNEFSALDLLCTSQMQIPYYPGLPRGLIAILLYYDGKKALLSTLRMLVQARKGILWSLKISTEIEQFITAYTDQLMENGLFNRIFELLKSLDLSKELEMLQQNVALGGPKHQRQVIDLYNSIRLILAEIVFLWAAQCGLPKQIVMSLISYLRELKLEEEPTGKLDNVSLYLVGALLSSIDLSVLNTREDGEEVIQGLPLLSEYGFVAGIATELLPGKEKWNTDGLYAFVMFAFANCLNMLRLVPQSQTLHEVLEHESVFIDTAIEMNVFRFIHDIVLANETIYTEEVLYKKMHNLTSNFIVLMFSKVKEMRIKADENARTMQVYTQQGLDAPNNLPRHFEDFLFFIAKLYEKDPLNLHCMLDYWCSLDGSMKENVRLPALSVSLFKFVKLAGDMIPSTLFVPYLNMLAGLSNCQQAARYCFNMLKQTSPGCTNTLTWDHFFVSFTQYYSNLRQELPPINDTVYRHRTIYHKGITPQEVQGLHAVLKLIRVIAVNDDFSRLALCEHPGWAPLSVLLGLVSCSVPIPLKSDILLTLAALSKSPETANQMWNNLEASQILVTIPSTSSYQPRGIQTELDEIETRLEAYPLTRGLLKLLDTLTDSGIPRTLGAGPRIPGFDPYFTFIVNSVFLKCNSRPYKNPDEKWEIMGMCLTLFEKFIQRYNPELSDFQNAVSPDKFNSPPGYHIMVQLNTKSDVLNLILAIVNEGINLFDSYKPISGQKFVEESILSCLNIIERCLTLQAKFFNLLSSSNCSVPMTSFSKLLLSVNPRSSRPDHVMNIAKFTNHQLTLPQHCLIAVKILLQLTSSSVIHGQLMNILLTHMENKSLRNGFFECLDSGPEYDDDALIATKEAILTLIKQCLPYKAPNLSHYLLGFDLTKDISATIFQSPGVLEFPRTCIHSLFGIMNSALNPTFNVKPSLLESTYQTLYLLSSNNKTCEPTLKLLRMVPNFFEKHISNRFKSANDGIHELNQLSWLLMAVAIEIKLCCRTKQIHYVRQLTQLLIDLPFADNISNPYTLVPSNNSPQEVLTVYGSTEEKQTGNSLLTKLITMFDFGIKEIDPPQWDFFDNAVLSNLLNNCQTATSPKLIDIKKLHQILMDELSILQGTAALGQRHAILQEIEKALVHALSINNTRQTAASMVRFVDSWRQIVEVLVTYMPYNILSSEEQQNFQLTLLEQLLKKIVNVVLLPKIGNLLSGAVLLLLENLRRCHMYSQKQRKIEQRDIATIPRQGPSVIGSNPTTLKSILNHLTDWILVADVTAQKLRVNLYGSLVTFLHLISIEHHTETDLEESSYVSRLDSSKLKIRREHGVQLSPDSFSIFGEKFIEILCHDCTGGQEVCKMLAMASFSLLISLSGNIHWIVYMSGRGYLKHMIQSILESDGDLKMVLEPLPTNMRNLYVYEAKMALLSRIATTRVGSELLLEQHLLSCLSNMKIFDYHPEISKQWEDYEDGDNFIPPIEYRYLQVWLPCMYLCNAVLTSLGTENQSAVVQITQFLLSHLDAVELVLRSGSPLMCSAVLKELSILTSLFARTANNDLISMLENFTVPQDNRAHLYRIQKLMLTLLGKFILTDGNIRELLCDPAHMNDNLTYQTSERLLHTLQIISNLMLYARNLVANHGIDHSCVGVIFQPTLNESVNNLNGKHYKNFNEHSPSLGVIVQHLIVTVQYFQKEKVTLNFLQNKVREIPRMDTADLKDFVSSQDDGLNLSAMRENAYVATLEKFKHKKREIGYCRFIIEHALYLIWAHLDYYMLKAIAKAKNFGVANVNSTINVDSTLASASETMWKVSTDDISNLKQGLVSIFTDSFSSQLLNTTENRSESDKGLIEALLRKVKRLIQFVPVK